MAPTEWARASGDDELRKELGFGRSDGRRLLPEARVDEAAPHRGLVEELHVPVRPARQDGKVAVVPLVVDAVEIGVQELLLDLQLGASGFLVLTHNIDTYFQTTARRARARMTCGARTRWRVASARARGGAPS